MFLYACFMLNFDIFVQPEDILFVKPKHEAVG